MHSKCLLKKYLKKLKDYDSSHPKLDELKFVNDLCERYGVGRNAIIQRIQDVRKINRYLKENVAKSNPIEEEKVKRK